jgi:hypothetical protein
MANPASKILGGAARRLLKWLIKHGREELEKEIDRRVEASPKT